MAKSPSVVPDAFIRGLASRYRLPAATIVSFWHIPWPPLHVLRVCPWARELVDGLLASDIAGFQTPGDCTNFINAAESMLGANVDPSSGTVHQRAFMA